MPISCHFRRDVNFFSGHESDLCKEPYSKYRTSPFYFQTSHFRRERDVWIHLDECTELENVCAEGLMCVNTLGSYECKPACRPRPKKKGRKTTTPTMTTPGLPGTTTTPQFVLVSRKVCNIICPGNCVKLFSVVNLGCCCCCVFCLFLCVIISR